jgi:pyridoxine 4-dehydrogenase
LAGAAAGEFYGQPDPTLNLRLLARFFAKYPEYQDRVFLSVKGGLRADYSPDGSLEGLRRSAININTLLASEGATKKMDLFEPARLDRQTGVEQVVRNMQVLAEEGHFAHIGLSEVSPATLRKGAAVGPIAAVEFELSPWALEPLALGGLVDTCKELGILAVAYSPLGKGFLTGSIKSRADIPEGDHRLHFDRFSDENFAHNLRLVDELAAFAESKGITPTQLALAWELAQWEGIIPIPGSSRVAGVKEALEAGQVQLSAEDLAKVHEIVNKHEVRGLRYNAALEPALNA